MMTRRAMSPGAALVAAVAVAVVVVVACGTAVEGQSPYEGPRDLIPNLRLCRTMPEARSLKVADGWKCDTPDTVPEGVMTCSFPMRDIALVIPFYSGELPLLLDNFKYWEKVEHFPCQEGSEATKHVDLVLILVSPDNTVNSLSEVESSLMNAVAPVRNCFRHVVFRSGQQVVPTPVIISARSIFYSLFGAEDFMVNHYTHFFWMDPNARPFRSNWVHALLKEVVMEYREMWQKAPMHFMTASSDQSMNWNSFYKLGDKEFNCALDHAWLSRNPDTALLGVFQELSRPDNRWQLHKSFKSEFLIFAKWRMYEGLSKDYPNSYFLFGENAWADVDEGPDRAFGKLEAIF